MFSSCCVFFHCQNCIPGTSTNLLLAGRLVLERPHGRATRTWSLVSSLCTSSYLDRWRVQSRGIFEQDTLVPVAESCSRTRRCAVRPLQNQQGQERVTCYNCKISSATLLPTLRLSFLQSPDSLKKHPNLRNWHLPPNTSVNPEISSDTGSWEWGCLCLYWDNWKQNLNVSHIPSSVTWPCLSWP